MNMPQALARGLSAWVLVAAFAPLPTLGFAQPAVASPMDRADSDKASRPAADMRPAKAGVVADLPPKPAAVARSSAKSCRRFIGRICL